MQLAVFLDAAAAAAFAKMVAVQMHSGSSATSWGKLKHRVSLVSAVVVVEDVVGDGETPYETHSASS